MLYTASNINWHSELSSHIQHLMLKTNLLSLLYSKNKQISLVVPISLEGTVCACSLKTVAEQSRQERHFGQVLLKRYIYLFSHMREDNSSNNNCNIQGLTFTASALNGFSIPPQCHFWKRGNMCWPSHNLESKCQHLVSWKSEYQNKLKNTAVLLEKTLTDKYYLFMRVYLKANNSFDIVWITFQRAILYHKLCIF